LTPLDLYAGWFDHIGLMEVFWNLCFCMGHVEKTDGIEAI